MTPEQKAQALLESQRKAEILRQLPADADFENIDQQIRLYELDQYVDVYGARRSLKESVAAHAQSNAKPVPTKRPAQKKPAVRRVSRPAVEETISFDPLPPPIDILNSGAR